MVAGGAYDCRQFVVTMSVPDGDGEGDDDALGDGDALVGGVGVAVGVYSGVGS